MAFHDDLLVQAARLARHEPMRPRQASLRRAISSAYYALFHLLTGAAASLVTPRSLQGLDLSVRRTFEHAAMKDLCKGFAAGNVPVPLQTHVANQLDPDLRLVADAFIELQQARHQADYDLGRPQTRSEALRLVQVAQDAFAGWARVRTSKDARVFLVALALPGLRKQR